MIVSYTPARPGDDAARHGGESCRHVPIAASGRAEARTVRREECQPT